ncbi:MAG: hypothetical protein IPN52_13330 [Micrococcales bacterium]|nr:hypothetical protein [Micrococcales bacterium]
MITHVVMMKLHDPADRVEAATRLRSMQGQIPDLLSVEVLIDPLGRRLFRPGPAVHPH